MIEHINIINCLANQISALLDLMQCCSNECTDIRSINTASEMCQTMFTELMAEVEKIESDWRENERIEKSISGGNVI